MWIFLIPFSSRLRMVDLLWSEGRLVVVSNIKQKIPTNHMHQKINLMTLFKNRSIPITSSGELFSFNIFLLRRLIEMLTEKLSQMYEREHKHEKDTHTMESKHQNGWINIQTVNKVWKPWTENETSKWRLRKWDRIMSLYSTNIYILLVLLSWYKTPLDFTLKLHYLFFDFKL